MTREGSSRHVARLRARPWAATRTAGLVSMGIALAVCLVIPAWAELPESLRFRHITTADGLAQNSIFAIHQDDSGFVWLGSQNGLHRYDGRELVVHRPTAFVPGSLQHGFVQALAGRAAGGMWVGTFAGLDRFDPATGEFIHLDLLHEQEPHITSLLEDPDGSLWVGTFAHGLLIRSPDGSITHLRPSANGLPDGPVWALVRTTDGKVWVGTGRGLAWIDDGRPHRVESLTGTVHGLLPIADHGLLVGGRGLASGDAIEGDGGTALLRLDLRTLETRRAFAGDVALGEVRSFHRDRFGALWIATWGNGLFVVESIDKGVVPVAGDLEDGRLWTVVEDHSGVLWLGTASAGVALTDPRPRIRQHTAGDRAGVRALYETWQGELWIGLDGGGLLIDRSVSGGTSVQLRNAEDDPNSLPNDRVWALAGEPPNRVWVGTDRGLAVVEDDDRIRRVSLGSAEPSVRVLAFASDDRLWIGTWGDGLIRRGAEGELTRWRHDHTDSTTLSDDRVLALADGPAGFIWVGTARGLDRLDPETGRVERYLHHARVPSSLVGSPIRGLHFDRQGSLWIATQAGLSMLTGEERRGSGGFVNWTSRDGLPDDTVYAVLEDRDGDMWVSTNAGLARIARGGVAEETAITNGDRTAITERDRSTITTYAFADGLETLEFNGNAAFTTVDGRLLFGGVRGYAEVDPLALRAAVRTPPVAFTAVTVYGHDGGRRRFDRPSSRLRLRHDDDMVMVETAVLDFRHPPSNRRQIRVAGIHDGWIDLGPRREMILGPLDPGSYRVELRGATASGAWVEVEPLEIEVAAPWWARPGTFLIYTVALLAIIGAWLIAYTRRRRARKTMLHALATSEQRLELALLGSGHGLWDFDLESGTITRFRIAELLGYHDEELPSGHDLRAELVHPDDTEIPESAMTEHRAGDVAWYRAEYRMRARDGSWRWILDRGKVVARDADGEPTRVAGISADITDRRATEDQIRLGATVFENAPDMVLITDAQGHIADVNPAAVAGLGFSRHALIGQPLIDLVTGDHPASFYRGVRAALGRFGDWRGETWQERSDGERFLAQVAISSVEDGAGEVTSYVVVASDVTHRKRTEDELRFLANYDPLTRLPNRAMLRKRLEQAISRATRIGGRAAILFSDLDRFKQVNDTLGHAVGDRLLEQVSERLRDAVRRDDLVARLGGDEITVLVHDVADRAVIEQVAKRIMNAFEQPFELDGHEIVASTSVGIAVFPEDGVDADTLLKHADTAMYQAKAAGRNRYAFFVPEMSETIRARLSTENQLRRALEHDEIELVFQPKVDLEADRVVGFEALARLRVDDELWRPARFLDVANDSGLIDRIDQVVLEQACARTAVWGQLHETPFEVAVNVSAARLHRDDFVDHTRAVLARHGLEASRLVLEVTESGVLEDEARTIERLSELKNLGVKIAIDDFGTGYSSFAALRRLPIDELKIDRSFVATVGSTPDEAAIVEAMMAMAWSLGIDAVAEGVETEAQRDFLRAGGCRVMQGYLIAPPLSVEALTAWLDNADD
ncbi:MAG: EAL domain-containing protein [Acidobacteriota bacterium]